MNGFDRVADGEDNWFHGPRSLPPTPEKFAADLWCEVNMLKNVPGNLVAETEGQQSYQRN